MLLPLVSATLLSSTAFANPIFNPFPNPPHSDDASNHKTFINNNNVHLLGHSNPTEEFKTLHDVNNLPDDLELDNYALPKCDQIKVRKEWRELTYDERKNFVDAIKCMRGKESWALNGLEMSDRWADFIRIHQWPGADIHWVAQFLPWHRGFTIIMHQQLKECGYEGELPYWGWEQDYANIGQSEIWDGDMEAGLGSAGHLDLDQGLNASEITDGAMADYVITFPWEHKIGRQLRSSFTPDGPEVGGHLFERGRSPEWIKYYHSFDSYQNFSVLLEGYDPEDPRADFPSSHGSIHLLTGGDMSTGDANNSSPADPLFFLHHANVDRHWTAWQLRDPDNRLFDFEGNIQFNWQTGHRGGQQADLDLPLYYNGTPGTKGLKVKHLMDTENWCFTYSNLEGVIPKFWEVRDDVFIEE